MLTFPALRWKQYPKHSAEATQEKCNVHFIFPKWMFSKHTCTRLNTCNDGLVKRRVAKSLESLINKKDTKLAQDSFSVSRVPRWASPLNDDFLTAWRNTSALFTVQPPSFGISFIVLLAGFHFPSDIFKREKNERKKEAAIFMTPLQISQILIMQLQTKAFLMQYLYDAFLERH